MEEERKREEKEAARMKQQIKAGSSSAVKQAASGDHEARNGKDKGKGKQPATATVESTPSPRSQSHTPKIVPQDSARSGPVPPPGITSGGHHSFKEVVQPPNKQNNCQHGPKQTIIPIARKNGPQKSVVAPNRRPADVVGEDRSGAVDDEGYEEAVAAAAVGATVESSRAPPMQATVESGSESDV